MPAAPEGVRGALQVVTGAALLEVQAVAAAAPKEPEAWRAELFAAAPLIVSEYATASAILAIDWFEEIRDEASPPHLFTPAPIVSVTDGDVSAMVARTTEQFHDPGRIVEDEFDQIVAEMMAEVEAEMQKQVATGFWDTMTGNADEDPDAAGWQRFARPGACKFCTMLADRGAVYRESTVHFAAHTNCGCVVGPSYDPDAPRADVMQYLASRRQRTPRERAALREYLTRNFPDAPG